MQIAVDFEIVIVLHYFSFFFFFFLFFSPLPLEALAE